MNMKTKPIRTIQMKYPAPYSLSDKEEGPEYLRTIKKSKKKFSVTSNISNKQVYSSTWDSDKADEKTKRRLRTGKQLMHQHQLPHSKTQSSEKEIGRVIGTSSPRRLLSFSQKSRRAAELIAAPVRPRRLPDPTAPHLKYGIFKPKRQSRVNRVLPIKNCGSDSSSMDRSSKRDIRRKHDNPPKAYASETPLVVVRPTDTRRLSVCKLTNVDIRPTRSRASRRDT